MNLKKNHTIQILFPILICFICAGSISAKNNQDTTPLSTQQQALAFLDKHASLKASNFWPNVKPAAFLQNLRTNVVSPLSIYEGRSTNFCAYAALSYLPLHDDPLTFVRFMIILYSEGKAVYGNQRITPSKAIKQAAGTLVFKGELDIRPADQLWFLTLADHFKGYLNLFNHNYSIGDENKPWASVNLGKFCRMVRKLFNYEINAIGSDLFRPAIRDPFEYLSEKLKTGTVALYLNNPDFYKKNHAWIRIMIPTHFIILLDVKEVGDKIAFTYWDYGGRTVQELTPKFLKKIIFGVVHITKKTGNEE